MGTPASGGMGLGPPMKQLGWLTHPQLLAGRTEHCDLPPPPPPPAEIAVTQSGTSALGVLECLRTLTLLPAYTEYGEHATPWQTLNSNTR